MKKNTIILSSAVLLCAAAGTIYYLSRPEPVPEETVVQQPAEDIPEEIPEPAPEEKPVEKPVEPEEDKGPKEIISISRDKLQSIEILQNGQELSLQKDSSGWIVNKGSAGRIIDSEVEKRIGSYLQIQTMKTVSSEASKEELTDFGLISPGQIFRIKTTDALLSLKIGNLSKEQEGVYVQIEGDSAVYLISQSIRDSLKLELDDLRDRKIALFNNKDIESMTIRNGSTIKIVPFERTDMFTSQTYDFMMEEPYRAYVPVGRKEFSALLESLNSPLIIKEFIDTGAPEDYGLSSASPMLFVKEKSGKTFELQIGSDYNDSTVYGKLAGDKQIFTLPKADLPFLKTEAYELTDKIPHLIDGEKIISFTITTDEMAIFCDIERREGQNIYLVNGMPAEEESFNKLFDKTIQISTAGEYRGDSYRDKAELTLSFQLRDGGSQWSHLRFFPMDNNRLAVSRNEDDPLFYVMRSEMEKAINEIIETTDRIMGF